MAEKPVPIQAFLDAVESWLAAVRDGSPGEATIEAEQLRAVGQLLSFDPQFRRLFLESRDHCLDDKPDHVLDCIHAFFQAVTEAAFSGRYRHPTD